MSTRHTKSDLRSNCATVQPRLYSCAVLTQITLKTEGPPGLPSDARLRRLIRFCANWQSIRVVTAVKLSARVPAAKRCAVMGTPECCPFGPASVSEDLQAHAMQYHSRCASGEVLFHLSRLQRSHTSHSRVLCRTRMRERSWLDAGRGLRISRYGRRICHSSLTPSAYATFSVKCPRQESNPGVPC
jgi:hypothetical protein